MRTDTRIECPGVTHRARGHENEQVSGNRIRSLRRAKRELVIRVHVENSDGGAADWCAADNEDALPFEMVFPLVSPRMKQFGDLIGLGIDTGQVRSFMEVAINTGQGKIVGFIRATVLLGDDVLDVQDSQRRVVLLQLAILAAMTCTLPDECLG